MLRKKKPIQIEIVLRSLVEAGERGLSSYRAYDPHFPVKRLASRIHDLKDLGCVIEAWGTKEKRYILRSVPALVVKRFHKYIPGLSGYLFFDRGQPVKEMTPIEKRIAEKEGELVRVYEGTKTYLVRNPS